MRKIRFLWIVLLLLMPHILVIIFDPASCLSLYNFVSDICGTIFFIDLPIGMCLLHYYFPQLFRHRKRGHYSIVPWGIFFLFCWGVVALGMFLDTQFGRYPENGFAVMFALPVVDFSGMEMPLYSDGFCTVINTWVSENSIRSPKSRTACRSPEKNLLLYGS